MEVDQLIQALDQGRGLVALTNLLGTDCLRNSNDVRADRYAELSDTSGDLLALSIVESRRMWNLAGDCIAPASDRLRAQLSKLRTTPQHATMRFLEGVCHGAALDYFLNVSSPTVFRRGDIVPLPKRWLPRLPTTPAPSTTHHDLFANDHFVIWKADDWTLELDFTFRDPLDLVCAVRLDDEDILDATGRVERAAYSLPKMATVHPLSSDDMEGEPDEKTGSRFFGVHPKSATPSGVTTAHARALDTLARVPDDVPVAVLPEFCLHEPGGVDGLVSERAADLPALIVAGSAHNGVPRGSRRANTSHVFLHGYRIMTVSKHVPFVWRNGGKNLIEDIEPQNPRTIRVAAGTATRLAVAICSDLNSVDFVGALTHAAINVLLSPSWSQKIGASQNVLAGLAGHCQCIGLVANTPGQVSDPTQPTFWATFAVPVQSENAFSHDYHGSPPAVGILDPNATGEARWTWVG